MKLEHISLRNFKVVREIDIDLSTRRGPRQLTAILGDNGSGKTSVLQAIAMVVSLATRRTRDPAQFEWHGFVPDRLATHGPVRIELRVAFEQDEVDANSELFRAWHDTRPIDWLQTHRIFEPSGHREVTLVYEDGRLSSPQGPEAQCQFLGRYYIKVLSATQPRKFYDWFGRVGDVFWFDQYRNLGTTHTSPVWWTSAGDDEIRRQPQGWVAGVENLRGSLKEWWGYHSSGRGRDYIGPIESKFAGIFPGTRILGPAERDAASVQGSANGLFLLERDGSEFDISEMSSGEQAVMPLVCEFVQLNIARSIVLIDELELHLHPPEQQALLAALSELGPDCQFLTTTHSPFLEGAIPPEWQFRLMGGRLCL